MSKITKKDIIEARNYIFPSVPFNEKYKEYLADRFNGLMLDNEEVVKYLDKEFEKLIKIDGFKYYQIKGKFNWFCFYADNVSSEKRQEIENKIKEIYEK